MNYRRVPALLGLAAVAAALVVRVAGYGRGWLPSAGLLAALLVLLHAVRFAAGASRFAEWRTFVRAHAFWLALGLLIVLALAVRLPNLGSDLGHAPLDIDEERFANNVRHYFITGELLHETVEHYPGLVFWMFAAASFVGYFKLLASGVVMAPSVIPIETFVISARVANVCVGAATVAFTGLIGRQVAGRAVGLGAAAIVAVVPLAVDVTTLVRNDPGMVLAVVVAVYAALHYAIHQQRGSLVTAATVAGVATGIKYSSVFALLPVLIASSTTGDRSSRFRQSAWAFAAFVVAVALTNHFVWWDFPNFLRQLNDQIAITGYQHWAATENPGAFYVMILDRFGVGKLLLVLAAGFFVYALSSRDARLWIFASFPVVYIWFMTQRPSQFPRWVYPLLPFVAVAGVAANAWIVRLVTAWAIGRPRSVRLAAAVGAAALVVATTWHPAWSGVVSFSRHIAVPTHTQAETWIAQHASPGDRVLLEQKWLDLSATPLKTIRVPDLGAALAAGIEQLPPCQWVIVPEVYFGHPSLRQLGLVHRVHAEQGFGGSIGYDYEIYAIPRR